MEKSALKQLSTLFLPLLGLSNAERLEGVCCDMWDPYIQVIRKHASNANMVFDKFHIVRHLNEAVDQVRRDEIREKGKEHKELVKDTRYIGLKNPLEINQ